MGIFYLKDIYLVVYFGFSRLDSRTTGKKGGENLLYLLALTQ
jgi:hypothetical protein